MNKKKTINWKISVTDVVMDFFRSDDFIYQLSQDDRDEIALACMSYNDDIYEKLEQAMTEYDEENKKEDEQIKIKVGV